jgi:hypothetical protein
MMEEEFLEISLSENLMHGIGGWQPMEAWPGSPSHFLLFIITLL